MIENRQNSTIKFKKVLRALLMHLLIFFCLAVYSLFLGCPLRKITGISCPGCGLSRACLSALRLDFQAAFAFHPLFPLAVLYLLYACHRKAWRLPGNTAFFFALTAVVLALFTAVWIMRMINQDPVVKPDYAGSALAEWVAQIQAP